ncbi:MAG: hypothetical protein A2756_05415 [Candidatus Ryanbacteria bacterium RIFCSPHIGHO2_01_FULL_48_27]|uniref:Resolvase/invertase-type recombinase catalytic domain-containing protein n=1 Tax=Candidatus Ryanbacteria bacterium RIFCSPHIGHO2_01_FULL_48_27 TaxID=1802115 RepID=A0A1G2G4B6_9BACT|nr:MAG: hypothetical protein A2756_05415 [Candidatus Ryanbacteria bacterium RIFCSPHIGHO2_01_FULL_48_27]
MNIVKSECAVIYVRAFVKNCPIEQQERICKEYVKSKGWKLLKVFRERPTMRWTPSAMSRLKTFATKHAAEIGNVVAYTPHTLARYKFQFFELYGFFRKLGIRLRFGNNYKIIPTHHEK